MGKTNRQMERSSALKWTEMYSLEENNCTWRRVTLLDLCGHVGITTDHGVSPGICSGIWMQTFLCRVLSILCINVKMYSIQYFCMSILKSETGLFGSHGPKWREKIRERHIPGTGWQAQTKVRAYGDPYNGLYGEIFSLLLHSSFTNVLGALCCSLTSVFGAFCRPFGNPTCLPEWQEA